MSPESSFSVSWPKLPGPGVTQPPRTSRAALDVRLERLRSQANAFARLAAAEKATLLREVGLRFAAHAERMVELGCAAKGIDPKLPVAGEEWFSTVAISLRALRLFANALAEVATRGAPALSFLSSDGETRVRLTPHELYDRAIFMGWSCEAWMAPGASPDSIRGAQARFYAEREPEGHVVLVLGAGNVGSISVLDVLYHSFVEGGVCLLKMSPVNAYLGPLYEDAFKPLIDRGFLAMAYGGAEEGEYLVYHPLVEAVHVTGSADTHDRIVWGPPGPERDARKRASQPLLERRVTSELGNVSPVLVVPAHYDARELDALAHNVAGMVMHNASFNCNAAKMIVTAASWPQREAFLERLGSLFASNRPRPSYYPGAESRFEQLLADVPRAQIRQYGEGVVGALPWTLVRDLSPSSASPLFRVEPFCSIVSETALPVRDVEAFLAAAPTFANDELWGTLNVMLIAPRSVTDQPELALLLERAVTELNYGTVGVNVWPAVGFGLGLPPWGGAPGGTLSDVQSGIGWGHNAALLDDVRKVVVRGPLLGFPRPFWYPGNAQLRELGQSLAAMEAAPSLPRLLRTAWVASRASSSR